MHETYDLGMILKTLREKKGLSQKELGEKISRDKGIISRYENNLQTPSFETMRDFSNIFKVSMDYLAGFQDSDNVSTFSLTDEQSKIVHDLVELFRSQNNLSREKLSSEQYEMLGRITASFMTK